jgi:L-asparaginase
MSEDVIQIFTTGGSIDKRYSTRDSDFIVGEPCIAGWLIDSGFGPRFKIESLMRKDSLQISDENRQEINRALSNCKSSRIVITHGTDTMIETALSIVDCAGKTIVLTGAMQPATFVKSDAHLNLGFALAAVQLLNPGIYIAMNGQIFLPENVRKDINAGIFVEG